MNDKHALTFLRPALLLCIALPALAATVSGCAGELDGDSNAAIDEAEEELSAAPLTIDLFDRSIRGVAIGMTATAVVAKFEPLRPIVTKYTDQGTTYLEKYRYGLTTVFVFYPANGRSTVTTVETTSPKVRTAGGIGVGSALSEVKRVIPGAQCTVDAHGLGRDTCFVSGPDAAARGVLQFYFEGHRVHSIALVPGDGGH